MSEPQERTLRQRSSLFRRTERGIPEMENAKRSSQEGTDAKRQRIKATFYLEPEDILAIDHLQTEAFRETGKKPERSVLVSRAIQEYLKNHQNGHSDQAEGK